VSQRSELRDRLNPYATAIPDSVLAAQARRYRDLFAVYVKYRDVISRVTFWGLRDGDSWLNDWPVRGRTSHPLLFDRQGRPKPAFEAILEVLRRPVIS
jgi:endo-1,4-beta-xylanase